MNFANVKEITIPEGKVSQIANAAGAILWKKASGGDYTLIDSLYIPRGSKLDTGIPVKSADLLYVDFAPLAATQYGTIVYAGTSKIMRVYIDGKNIQGKIDWYNTPVATASAGTRLNISFENQIIYVNGVQKVNMSTVGAFTADTNLIIGGLGTQWQLFGVKHGVSAENLDYDAVPAVRNSDQTAGLYDKISQTFTPYGTDTNAMGG